MVSICWDAGYEDLLELVGLPPLEQRRIYLKLCLLYKITHGLCHFPTGIFTPRQIPHNFRMNSFQLYQPFARTKAFQFSFVPHTISLWNSLHTEQVAGSYSELSYTIDHNENILITVKSGVLQSTLGALCSPSY